MDIFVADNEDEFEGKITKWQNILHGDAEGLKSFARLLTRIADLKQDDNTNLPIGEREHIHLRPNLDINKSSVEVIVGRMDAKGSGTFYGDMFQKMIREAEVMIKKSNFIDYYFKSVFFDNILARQSERTTRVLPIVGLDVGAIG